MSLVPGMLRGPRRHPAEDDFKYGVCELRNFWKSISAQDMNPKKDTLKDVDALYLW